MINENSEKAIGIEVINLGGERALLWDDYYIDNARTTASRIMHAPVKRQCIMVHDKPWEGDCCTYYHIVKAENKYRLYYKTSYALKPRIVDGSSSNICVLESEDGLSWERINVGNVVIKDYSDNNIIKDSSDYFVDNFTVFYDDNPKCPVNEKYKAVSSYEKVRGQRYLMCFTSEDGLVFKKGWPLFGPLSYKPLENYSSDTLWFDSMNIPMWDKAKNKYVAYVRGFHDIPFNPKGFGDERDMNFGVRDIRITESEDFKHWSVPQRINFNSNDYPLYTSNVFMYFNASNMLIGFPTRYVEYPEWNDSFSELCSKEIRKENIEKFEKRSGLALTDAIFMFSRDGYNWIKYDEAIFTPGPEKQYQWTYGNCYPSCGIIMTPEDREDFTMSMYMADYYRAGKNPELYRYTIRVDGFVSYFGLYSTDKLTTKPFIFKGKQLKINFSTSSAGYVKITIYGMDGNAAVSQAHFGNKTDRVINFDKDLSLFEGKPVVMEIELKDAHIYSFIFD